MFAWFNMVKLNKTHATILVCAADDFRKNQKMQKLRFKKNHKRLVSNHLNFNLIKSALKTLKFFKKLILHFGFLNPIIVKR